MLRDSADLFLCALRRVIRSNGTYMMIGEATSSHHAWVVGALESAVRAVYQFLWVRSRDSYACSEAAKMFVRGEYFYNDLIEGQLLAPELVYLCNKKLASTSEV